MTYALVAVAAFIAGAVIWRHRTRPTVDIQQQIADGFWRGYRKGHDDGRLVQSICERTPSPN